ncbi:SRPBCC family protein [Rhodococcus phenolicus]|uniref:SRPBCC family protein n=1 Tax=Rhodococcus phenolicus TaxID=263849 RepID=UPI000834756F|nr:SRPBCC family protein [Rhodococcus phenolicus]
MGTLARHGRSEAITTAPAEALWHIITDVTRTGEWSHECRAAHWRRTGRRAAPGVRFRGTNRSGVFVWSRSCMFTAVDAPRTLAWKTVGLWGKVDSTEWRIDLEPAGTGTRIVQSYDVLHVAPGLDRVYWLLVKAHRDRRDALADDLQRLARLAENDQDRQAA